MWGTSSPYLVNEIDHKNAGAAKIVFRLRNDISDKDAFAGTRWLSISDLYKMKLLTLMNSVHTNQPKFQVWLAIVYLINTRYVTEITPQYHVVNFNLGRTTLAYRGPMAWNLLTEQLKTVLSLQRFKEACINNNKHSDFSFY